MYSIEVWKNGVLMIRSEESDSLESTKRRAQMLQTSLDSACDVRILVEGLITFHSYEWDYIK